MNHNIDHGFTGTEIIHGDVLHVLPTFPDGLFGGILTDPPTKLGIEPPVFHAVRMRLVHFFARKELFV